MMMNDIGIDKKQQRYIIKKVINIAIRATYYIFCCRNRNWDSPDLMQFCFFLLFGFCFVLFLLFVFYYYYYFLIIQSQAAFVNCLYVARFTIVHSKTQIKFPLLLSVTPARHKHETTLFIVVGCSVKRIRKKKFLRAKKFSSGSLLKLELYFTCNE